MRVVTGHELSNAWKDRLGVESLAVDVCAGLLQAYVARFVNRFPIPPGPALIVTNHPFVLDLFMTGLASFALTGIEYRSVARDRVAYGQVGDFARYVTKALRAVEGPRRLTIPDPIVVSDRDPLAKGGLEAAFVDTFKSHGLVIAIQGRLSTHESEPMRVGSSTLLSSAVRCGVPIIPMRVVGSVPDARHRMALLPSDNQPVDFLVSEPILPWAARSTSPIDLREMVFERMNGLALTEFGLDERPHQTEAKSRINALQLETGSSFLKCATIDALRQMENPGQQTIDLLDYLGLHNESMKLPKSLQSPETTELVFGLTDGLAMCVHERKVYENTF